MFFFQFPGLSYARSTYSKPDGDLLARVNAGDPDSLETLYDRYSPYAHGLALRMLGSREEADEVTRDVFWFLWKHKIQYDPERGRFSSSSKTDSTSSSASFRWTISECDSAQSSEELFTPSDSSRDAMSAPADIVLMSLSI